MLGRRTDGWAVGGTGAGSVPQTDVTLSTSTPLSAGFAKGSKLRFTARVLAVLRSLAGMPDYTAYLEHLRRCHPERPLPSEREFYEEFTRARYGDGPTRCC